MIKYNKKILNINVNNIDRFASIYQMKMFTMPMFGIFFFQHNLSYVICFHFDRLYYHIGPKCTQKTQNVTEM